MPIRRRQRGQRDGEVLELARRLGALLSELGLSEIEAAVGEIRVRLQRGGGSAPAPPPAPALASGGAPAAPGPAQAEAPPMGALQGPMVRDLFPGVSPAPGPDGGGARPRAE